MGKKEMVVVLVTLETIDEHRVLLLLSFLFKEKSMEASFFGKGTLGTHINETTRRHNQNECINLKSLRTVHLYYY